MSIQDKTRQYNDLICYSNHIPWVLAKRVKDKAEKQIYHLHHDNGYMFVYDDGYSGPCWDISDNYEFIDDPLSKKLKYRGDKASWAKYKSLFQIEAEKIRDNNDYQRLLKEIDTFITKLKKELELCGFANINISYEIKNNIVCLKEKGLLTTNTKSMETSHKCVIISYSVDW